MPKQDYLTVGQLARRVGTTVRTIQYYDQQGLLTPSAKGPGNQRLYSHEDEESLYRILTLKYLGLSLSDIRAQKESVNDVEAFREMLSHTMESIETDFHNLVKRLSVLRELFEQATADADLDWTAFAHTIEDDNGDDSFFWHRFAEGAAQDAAGGGDGLVHGRGMAVAKWHELVADAIALMSDGVRPDDPRAAMVVQRYDQLEESQAGSLDQAFILAENITPHHDAEGSFDALRDSVVSYLEQARAACAEGSGAGESSLAEGGLCDRGV